MAETMGAESDHNMNIGKVYKYPRPTNNMGETMEPITKKTARINFKKAGESIAEKIGKNLPLDSSLESAEYEYKPPEIDWDKVTPRVKPSYTKKVEMKIIKKTRSKQSRVSFD